MATLAGRRIQDTFAFVLCVDHAGGIDATARPVQDGAGNASALSLGTASATIAGTFAVSGAVTGLSFTGVGTGLTALTPDQCVPSQTGNAGKYLKTDGTNVAWAAGGGAVDSVFGRTGAVTATSGDYSVGDVTGAAPLDSPVFINNPRAPTPSAGDNDTSLATTAYVQTELSMFATGGGAATAINLLGAYASIPAAGTAGRTYRATDAEATWRDNGSNWDLVSPVYVPTAGQIDLSAWTAANLGTSTVTQVGRSGQGGIVYWDNQKQSGDQLRYYKKALPSASNYTIYCTLRISSINSVNNVYAFFGTRDSASGKADVIWLIMPSSANTFNVGAEEWTNDTTYSGQINSSRQPYLGANGNVVHFRIRDDATNRYWDYSPDGGFTWRNLTSKGRTTFQTPDQMFFGMGQSQNTLNSSAIFYACY